MTVDYDRYPPYLHPLGTLFLVRKKNQLCFNTIDSELGRFIQLKRYKSFDDNDKYVTMFLYCCTVQEDYGHRLINTGVSKVTLMLFKNITKIAISTTIQKKV